MREEPQDYSLMDNTEVEWDQNKLDLIRKGQKFVPAPKWVDTVAKFNHFDEFARKLRLNVFFNKRTSRELANQQQEARDQEKAPWEQMSSFPPTPRENAVLERFLIELFAYLFNPKNRNKFKDNLRRREREALKEMQRWNRDPENPRVIMVQDKGSRFVIDWKSRYSLKHWSICKMRIRLGKQMGTQMNLFLNKWQDGQIGGRVRKFYQKTNVYR